VQNLNPIRVVARRERDVMLLGALLLIGGLVLSAFSVLLLLVILPPSAEIIGILLVLIGLIIVIAGIVLVVRGLTYRRDNEEAKQVGDILGRDLDQRFVYIRNVGKRNLGYIDALLIGPPGALVLRITNATGSFLNEGQDWLQQEAGGRSLKLRHNFTREAITDVHALRDYLAAKGLDNVPVYGAVVFTEQNVQIATRQPVVPVAKLDTLRTVLQMNYLAKDRISQDVVKQAVDIVYS